MGKIQEKFSYKKVTQQHALGLAKAKAKQLVEHSDELLDEGLYLIHAPQEKAYYVEDQAPMLRPHLGEEIIWQL